MNALTNSGQDASDLTRSQKGRRAFREMEQIQAGLIICNRYKIRELLGRGGFGVVFAAYDQVLQSEVALKFLDPGLSLSVRKFRRVRREINLSRRITDPRIVKVFSLESWRGLHFLVMERVQGRSLADYLQNRSGPVSWDDFAKIFLSILEGVKVLHRHGIVHRDIKPSNIFLVGDNIKILDFGMAKEVNDPEQTSELGETVGSPMYMSPEQILGRAIGPASDIYQLGLILYLALSGHHPFPSRSNTVEVLFQQLQGKPPAIKIASGRLPHFLNEAVFRALEKNPRHRFADIEAMISTLRRQRPARMRVPRWARKRAVMIAGLIFLVVFAAIWLGHPLRVTNIELDQTRVKGTNALGIPLWNREFSPQKVYQVTPFSLDDMVPESWNIVPQGRRGVRVLSIPVQNKAFPMDFSLGTLETDSRLVLMDGRGHELLQQPFTRVFQLDTHGYTRRFYPYGFRKQDVNGDGRQEQLMLVRHSQGMFPSALVLLRGGGFSVLTSPGVISRYRVVERDASGVVFQVLAMANPLSHMNYLARVRMNLDGPWQYVHALPNRHVEQSASIPQDVLLLPRGARIEREGPGGEVVFKDHDAGDHWVYHFTDGVRILKNGREKMRFRDDPAIVSAVLATVQRSYVARTRSHNPHAALRELSSAFASQLENPCWKSALHYMRGDLWAEMGEYAAARKDLETALDANPFNMDAGCRLSETIFLQGDSSGAEKLVRERFGDHFMFWGLSNGRDLFLMWLELHSGSFREARERVNTLFFDKPGLGLAYGGLIDLFAGDYNRACDAFEKARKLPPNLFTVAEFRLFFARALVTSGRDPDRARFLLRDLKTHSSRQGWRTGVLRAWLDAENGDRSPALKRRARESWKILRERARGDLQARLWLFLDAWCYGRTMETLGETEAAQEGYRACVQANPLTGAAADARKRLNVLGI
ncbi:MAG: protein kinase [Candidatus Aminicenantes bacterium]|nr:protein kinase [Candidatus Aminicenantes bacterium]